MFVFVRVGSRDCLFIVFLFVSFGRTQWLQSLQRTKKNKPHCLFVFVCLFVVSLFVRLFIWLLACLFVCLIIFPLVSFVVSLLFDDRCSSKYSNLDEYFDTDRRNNKVLRTHKEHVNSFCV